MPPARNQQTTTYDLVTPSPGERCGDCGYLIANCPADCKGSKRRQRQAARAAELALVAPAPEPARPALKVVRSPVAPAGYCERCNYLRAWCACPDGPRWANGNGKNGTHTITLGRRSRV